MDTRENSHEAIVATASDYDEVEPAPYRAPHRTPDYTSANSSSRYFQPGERRSGYYQGIPEDEVHSPTSPIEPESHDDDYYDRQERSYDKPGNNRTVQSPREGYDESDIDDGRRPYSSRRRWAYVFLTQFSLVK
jgi:hypothetical protein